MRKISLLMLLTVSFNSELFANQEESSDSNRTKPKSAPVPIVKDGYMPDIITPENLKSGFYSGLGIAGSLLDIDGTNYWDKNYMVDVSILAGYNINKYFAAETRALVSVAYDNGVDFKSWGIFLKPKYELYKGLDIYSLIGYGKTSAKAINSEGLRSSKTSAQIGIGANYKLKNNFKLFVDYTYFGKDEEGKYRNESAIFKSGALTTGVTYDF